MNNNQFVLVSYLSRSGSTYLTNFLSSNKNILVCPEAEILINLLLESPLDKIDFTKEKWLYHKLYCDKKFLSWDLNLNHDEIIDLKNNLEIFLFILSKYKTKTKPDAGYIVFKGESLNNLASRLTRDLLITNNIRFIFIVRDGRAIFNSQKKSYHSLLKLPMEVNPISFSKKWNKYIDNVTSITTARITHYQLVKYEDLIQDFNLVINKILFNLGIQDLKSFSFKSADLLSRIPDNQKHLHTNVQNKPDISKIHQWNTLLSRSEIVILQFYMHQKLKSMDYTIIDNISTYYKKKLYITFHSFIFITKGVYLRARKFLARRIIRFKNKTCTIT